MKRKEGRTEEEERENQGEGSPVEEKKGGREDEQGEKLGEAPKQKVEEESDEAWLLRKKEERKLVEGSSSVSSEKAKECDALESASIAPSSGVEPRKQANVPTTEEEEESTCVNKDDMEDDDDDEEDEEEGDSSGLWAPPRQLCLAEFLPAGEFCFLPPAR